MPSAVTGPRGVKSTPPRREVNPASRKIISAARNRRVPPPLLPQQAARAIGADQRQRPRALDGGCLRWPRTSVQPSSARASAYKRRLPRQQPSLSSQQQDGRLQQLAVESTVANRCKVVHGQPDGGGLPAPGCARLAYRISRPRTADPFGHPDTARSEGLPPSVFGHGRSNSRGSKPVSLLAPSKRLQAVAPLRRRRFVVNIDELDPSYDSEQSGTVLFA